MLCGRDPVLLDDARRGPSRHGDALRPRRPVAPPARARRSPLPSLFAAAGPAFAQQVPPASESIVVTATSVPEDETKVGSAITVITREELEKHESAVVSDVLRSIPGLDVVQYGTPGSLTSLFTRGTNSTQTLVLIDGVRMNSPYFSGYDWSGMTTENIERIEIARGPYSALYGSDAIGGVVQIFTRPGADGVSGRATGEAGNEGQGQGSAFVSAGEGPITATASYRYVAFDGDRPNSDWRQRNGSASLQARLVRNEPDRRRVGLERRRGRQSRTRRLAEHGAGHDARGPAVDSGNLRPLGHEPARRGAGRRALRALLPRHGRRLRLADRRADAAGERLGHREARRPHADGLRLVAALAGQRREQLRRQPRRRRGRPSGASAPRTR